VRLSKQELNLSIAVLKSVPLNRFTTIAGLVINESGKVPRSGEHLTFRGLDVEVLEADERRISRLRLKRASQRTRAKVKPVDDY
jgi:CBS domain containing-hemolysin-like protein